ncbi:MAG: o-succinylbenzoate synthase [Thermostichales cyanobacterium GMQP_bins_62]
MRWHWQCYHHPFRDPLVTAEGVWSVREGILLAGPGGQAEIAPLPGWGSESLAAAIAFCQGAPADLDPEWLTTIPDHLPATQFGFTCLLNPLPDLGWPPTSARLLGSLSQALSQPLDFPQPVTVKLKIGLLPPKQEQQLLTTLLHRLPPGSQVRLDANARLTLDQSRFWLEWCQDQPVEYLEQPVGDPDGLWQLAQEFPTPIAIDESLGKDLCLWQDWPGVLVIKPSLWGCPYRLLQQCRQIRPDAVISSAMETAVGYGHVIRVGQQLRPWLRRQRPWGVGITQWTA